MNNYENFEELFGKKKGKKGGIKDKIKKAIEKVKDKGKDAVLTPLLPLKPAMKKALDKKKVKHDNTISDIAAKFAKYVIQKKEGFENENFVAAVASLVPIILAFFKKLKDDKAAGIQDENVDLLDVAEKSLAVFNPDAAINQEENAQKRAATSGGSGRSSENDGSGGGEKDNTMIFLLVAVVVVFLFMKD